jgi:hypothetical protein
MSQRRPQTPDEVGSFINSFAQRRRFFLGLENTVISSTVAPNLSTVSE